MKPKNQTGGVLETLLIGTPQEQAHVPKKPKNTQFSIVLPTDLHEWLQDFLYHKNITTGDFSHSISGVIRDAVEYYRENQPKIEPRPPHAKLKRGRR